MVVGIEGVIDNVSKNLCVCDVTSLGIAHGVYLMVFCMDIERCCTRHEYVVDEGHSHRVDVST